MTVVTCLMGYGDGGCHNRKAKGMFGLKVKKKKKVNTGLVLTNEGALGEK